MSRKVLIVDDEPDICRALALLVERQHHAAVVAGDGETALEKVRTERPDLLLVDLKLPGIDGMEVMRRAKALDSDLPVILITAYADLHGAVNAIKAGAHDYLAKPFDHGEVTRVVLRALRERELRCELSTLSSQLRHQASLRELFGPSDAAARLIAEVQRVARSEFTVVLTGETGSGKELVAQAIHQASARADAPFVPVDCGAIPEPLLESELFGHEKGAFTGAAAQHTGRFEAAHGGTLFLDEISNLPLGSQAKLLRAIQEKSIFRVGATKRLSVNVRLIAATNQDLQALADSGAFRRDLFFRLNEFTLRVPPLRERRDDILYLAKRFLDLTNAELQKDIKGFSDDAVELLLTCDWPGNVRQLRSTIRRAVLLADSLVASHHLDCGCASRRALPSPEPPVELGAEGISLREVVRRQIIRVERETIAHVLRLTGGNKARAARLLHVDYKTIHLKVKEYGIEGKEISCSAKVVAKSPEKGRAGF